MSLEQTETYMDQLCDGVRVRMEVSDGGLVTYEFPELTDRLGSSGPVPGPVSAAQRLDATAECLPTGRTAPRHPN